MVNYGPAQSKSISHVTLHIASILKMIKIPFTYCRTLIPGELHEFSQSVGIYTLQDLIFCVAKKKTSSEGSAIKHPEGVFFVLSLSNT